MKTITRLLCLFLTGLLLNLTIMPPVFAESAGKEKESKGDVTPHTPQMILSGESDIPKKEEKEKSWLGKNKWWVLLGVVAVVGGVIAAGTGGGDDSGGGDDKPASSECQVFVEW